ncbi:uncharacterized protein LOC115455315 isoform X1 [Manduca sexta]|uniref:uncharacterized protein LOC115455315 isoform X1 n=1 Tax=Manduca sexta TaxID=7130 RepID=UPI001182D1F5|nr:uncharacterized protein LOC115455315 isoform X1 [Manduca sexta]
MRNANFVELYHYDLESMERPLLLALRLGTLVMLVSLLTMHIRSLRVFRWEQSVSGGVLVTFCLASLGLALCAGNENCGGRALQAYLCGAGAALLSVNAAAIWNRWRHSGELTHVVAELLVALGVPLKRHVIVKVTLSAAAAVAFLIDLALAPILSHHIGQGKL